MKLKGTHATLLEIEQQINSFPFALQCLISSRINDWLKENPKLTTIKETIAKKHKEFFEMDEDNRPKMRDKVILSEAEIKMPPEHRPREMVMLEGKTFDQYQKWQEEYLKKEIEIIF